MLNEIDKLPPLAQATLLQFLQDGTFFRECGNDPEKVTVRLIGTTTASLKQCVDSGRFLDELLRRITCVSFTLPPLRDRRGDIPLLLDRFLEKHNRAHGKEVKLDKAVRRMMEACDWPSNVGGLELQIEGIVAVARENEVVTPAILKELHEGGLHIVFYRAPDTEPLPDAPTMQAAASDPGAGTHPLNTAEWVRLWKADPEGLLRRLGEQVGSKQPGDWLRFAEQAMADKKEELVLNLLKACLGVSGWNRCTDLKMLLNKAGNDPRHIYHYTAILYLVLHEQHTCGREEFGPILGLKSWDQPNKVLKRLIGGPITDSEGVVHSCPVVFHKKPTDGGDTYCLAANMLP